MNTLKRSTQQNAKLKASSSWRPVLAHLALLCLLGLFTNCASMGPDGTPKQKADVAATDEAQLNAPPDESAPPTDSSTVATDSTAPTDPTPDPAAPNGELVAKADNTQDLDKIDAQIADEDSKALQSTIAAANTDNKGSDGDKTNEATLTTTAAAKSDTTDPAANLADELALPGDTVASAASTTTGSGVTEKTSTVVASAETTGKVATEGQSSEEPKNEVAVDAGMAASTSTPVSTGDSVATAPPKVANAVPAHDKMPAKESTHRSKTKTAVRVAHHTKHHRRHPLLARALASESEDADKAEASAEASVAPKEGVTPVASNTAAVAKTPTVNSPVNNTVAKPPVAASSPSSTTAMASTVPGTTPAAPKAASADMKKEETSPANPTTDVAASVPADDLTVADAKLKADIEAKQKDAEKRVSRRKLASADGMPQVIGNYLWILILGGAGMLLVAVMVSRRFSKGRRTDYLD